MDYEIRPLQLRLLKILQAVDAACRQRGLRYYIIAGTLLGAVRHGGFIPWDDDLDIAMPRPDYDRLVKHWKEWLPPHLEMIGPENDPDYPFPFGKIQDAGTTLVESKHFGYLGGIYIDVFPLDGMTDSAPARRSHFARYKFYRRALCLIYRDPYRHGRGPSSWAPLLTRRLFTRRGLHEKLQQIFREYPYETSPSVVEHDNGARGAIPKEWVEPAREILFEGIPFMTFAEPEKYLAHTYGDYMALPPADRRHQHRFHLLDLDHPYASHPAVPRP